MSPRRVTGDEERELLAAQAELRQAQAEAERLLAERDRLIAELLDANARVADIAEVLGLTPKAVRDPAVERDDGGRDINTRGRFPSAIGARAIVAAGDPPVRRAILVLNAYGFSESAYRYYLAAVEADNAVYTYGGEVQWPPEAARQVIKSVTDQRSPVAESAPPDARLNGNYRRR